MVDSIESALKFKMTSSIPIHGFKTVIRNSSLRAKFQSMHAIFCIFLFLLYLFTSIDSKALGFFTPFLMPFLFFVGSLSILMLYRTLIDSDIRGYFYMEKSAKLRIEPGYYAEIYRSFSPTSKKTRDLKKMKLENFFYIGIVPFIAGFFAIGTLWRESWFSIVGVACCFIAMGLVFGTVFNRDMKRVDNIKKESCGNSF